MSDLEHYLECNNCHEAIVLKDIKLDCQIVSKDVEYFFDCSNVHQTKKVVAVRYYFNCPKCKQEYTCFFKDKEVDRLFDEGKQAEAQARMQALWELFADEY